MLVVNKKRRWLLLELGLMLLLTVADQWFKWRFQMRDMVVMNRGGFLGILPSFWWLAGLLGVWFGLFLYWLKQLQGIQRFGMLLILAGGLGNLIDRVLFGSVRDFIYYPMFGFYGNVADILLVIGVLTCLVSGFLLQYRPCLVSKE